MGIDPLKPNEFESIRSLLIEVCGIELKEDQDYLVETRLTELAYEQGAKNFGELVLKIREDQEILTRVIDLMTTNETLWFRDDSCWKTLEEKVVLDLIASLEKGQPKVRIWSAASSTGQEGYSLSILIDEILRKLGKLELLDRIEILGTDISQGAIFLAKNGHYDPFTISRGLSQERLEHYFTKDRNSFVINDEIKSRIKFIQFNLMDDFSSLGKFDLVLCRNVAIYFSKDFKLGLFDKIASSLNPDAVMILGASESLYGLETKFVSHSHGNGVYFKLRDQL